MVRPRRAETYRHKERALLRPEVGTQAQFRKRKPPKTYRYDSSLSPALDWDGRNPARELGEWLIAQIEEAAASSMSIRHFWKPPTRFRARRRQRHLRLCRRSGHGSSRRDIGIRRPASAESRPDRSDSRNPRRSVNSRRRRQSSRWSAPCSSPHRQRRSPEPPVRHPSAAARRGRRRVRDSRLRRGVQGGLQDRRNRRQVE